MASRPGKAAEAYREALEELAHQKAPKRIHQAVVEHHLGRLLREQGDLEMAKEFLNRAFEARLELRHPAHRETLARHLELAFVHQLEGRLDAAEEQLRRVVELRRGHLGSEHPKTAEVLVHLGRLLAERGDVGGGSWSGRLRMQAAPVLGKMIVVTADASRMRLTLTTLEIQHDFHRSTNY